MEISQTRVGFPLTLFVPMSHESEGGCDYHSSSFLARQMFLDPAEPLTNLHPGSLYTFDLLKKSKHTVRSKIVIPNSVGWSPDGKTLFFTDTIAKQMIAWDYDATDGSISNERDFYKHEGTGGPDGFRVDKDGNIWHAVYGESRVIKISPEGKIVGQIKLPTSNITCCEFVGTELFITTAADGVEGDAVKFGGGLFRVDVGTTGLGHNPVKLPYVNGAVTANGSA